MRIEPATINELGEAPAHLLFRWKQERTIDFEEYIAVQLEATVFPPYPLPIWTPGTEPVPLDRVVMGGMFYRRQDFDDDDKRRAIKSLVSGLIGAAEKNGSMQSPFKWECAIWLAWPRDLDAALKAFVLPS